MTDETPDRPFIDRPNSEARASSERLRIRAALRKDARRRSAERIAALKAKLAGFRSPRSPGAVPVQALLKRERAKAEADAEAERLEAEALRFLEARLPAGIAAVSPDAARLALPALCRQDGCAVRFSGSPATDGRTIWLGPVDFESPLAPVYVWGHGIHERNHVRYTDLEALALGSGSARTVRLANLLEDVRVDALGLADYPGWRLWREALVLVLAASGRCAFGRRAKKPADLPGLFAGWLLMRLMQNPLGLDLPEDACRVTEAAAAERFGGAHEKALALVLDRWPIQDSAAARALAEELAELLDAERFAAEIDERSTRLLQAAAPDDPARHAAWAAAEARRAALEALSEAGAWGPQESASRRTAAVPNLLAGGELLEGVRELAALLTLPEASALDADAYGGDWSDSPASPTGLAKSLRASHAADAWRRGAASPEIIAAADESGFELANGSSWALAQEAAEAFDACWADSGPFDAALLDALRRPSPEPAAWTDAGFELDGDRLDLVRTGDARVFLADAPRERAAPAVQILVDLSGSVAAREGALLKTAALRLEEALRSAAGAACRIAAFPDASGRGVFLASDWGSPAGTAADLLRPISGRGPTPLPAALLWAAASMTDAAHAPGGPRKDAPKLLFVFTDGRVRFEPLECALAALSAADVETAILIARRPGSGPDSDPTIEAAAGAPVMTDAEAAEAAKRLFGASWEAVSGWEAIPEALLELVRGMRRDGRL